MQFRFPTVKRTLLLIMRRKISCLFLTGVKFMKDGPNKVHMLCPVSKLKALTLKENPSIQKTVVKYIISFVLTANRIRQRDLKL